MILKNVLSIRILIFRMRKVITPLENKVLFNVYTRKNKYKTEGSKKLNYMTRQLIEDMDE